MQPVLQNYIKQNKDGQALPTTSETARIFTDKTAIIAIQKQFPYVVTIYVIS
jgi:hypothetical protein